MSDKIIPFRRRAERPAPAEPASSAEPAAGLQAAPSETDEEWTLVTIVAKAPPSSR